MATKTPAKKTPNTETAPPPEPTAAQRREDVGGQLVALRVEWQAAYDARPRGSMWPLESDIRRLEVGFRRGRPPGRIEQGITHVLAAIARSGNHLTDAEQAFLEQLDAPGTRAGDE